MSIKTRLERLEQQMTSGGGIAALLTAARERVNAEGYVPEPLPDESQIRGRHNRLLLAAIKAARQRAGL